MPNKCKRVSAITSNSAKVTLSGNVGDLTPQDFNVVGDLSVVDVEISGKTATLTFNKDMTDGAEYTLQLLNENDEVTSEKTFKYELGEVAKISLTKSTFEIGENVKDFLKVYDDAGLEISTADYNVVNVESSNAAVIDNVSPDDGKVLTTGHSNLRFEIEYKDGSKTKSDFIRVDVEKAVTADLAGFELDDTSANYDNTVDYRNNGANAKTAFYFDPNNSTDSDAPHNLYVYADDSKENPEIKPLDLKAGGDYKVTSKTPTVVTVSQTATDAELTPVSTGKATIVIEGPNNYKKTITVEVKDLPVYKDLALGASNIQLSDEALNDALGVNQEEVALQFVDQYGDKHDFDLTGINVVDSEEIVIDNAINTGDKLVISAAKTKGAFTLEGVTADAAGVAQLEVESVADKTTKDASIRVSYYADATANKYTTQKIISTTVVDSDIANGVDDYETLLTNPAIDASGINNTSELTVYALDSNGYRIDDVSSTVVLSQGDAVSNSEFNSWFATPIDNTFTFASDVNKVLSESGAVELGYTVAGASDPHGTVTVNYDNSFGAPDKATVNTKPVLVDTSSPEFSSGINVEELLFGKILADSPELVIDDVALKSNTATSPSIAIKKGQTGYANTPVLNILDNKGKKVSTGAHLYGLEVASDTTGNGYLLDAATADGTYDADTVFDVEYSITNAKDLDESAAGTLGNTLTIDGSAEQASFTIVITKVTVAGDTRVNNAGTSTKKNLLDAPKSVDVILKK